jgi:hypothetical protein
MHGTALRGAGGTEGGTGEKTGAGTQGGTAVGCGHLTI